MKTIGSPAHFSKCANRPEDLRARYASIKPTSGEQRSESICKVSIMKRSTRHLALLAAFFLLIFSSSANAGELIYSQLSDNQSTFGPSQLWSATAVNSEVADDFN